MLNLQSQQASPRSIGVFEVEKVVLSKTESAKQLHNKLLQVKWWLYIVTCACASVPSWLLLVATCYQDEISRVLLDILCMGIWADRLELVSNSRLGGSLQGAMYSEV